WRRGPRRPGRPTSPGRRAGGRSCAALVGEGGRWGLVLIVADGEGGQQGGRVADRAQVQQGSGSASAGGPSATSWLDGGRASISRSSAAVSSRLLPRHITLMTSSARAAKGSPSVSSTQRRRCSAGSSASLRAK